MPPSSTASFSSCMRRWNSKWPHLHQELRSDQRSAALGSRISATHPVPRLPTLYVRVPVCRLDGWRPRSNCVQAGGWAHPPSSMPCDAIRCDAMRCDAIARLFVRRTNRSAPLVPRKMSRTKSCRSARPCTPTWHTAAHRVSGVHRRPPPPLGTAAHARLRPTGATIESAQSREPRRGRSAAKGGALWGGVPSAARR